MVGPEQSLAALFRAMGDLSRLKVLLYIMEGPRNVSEIVRFLEMKQSLVSHHLKILRQCGLVMARRNGPFVSYCLANERIAALVKLARDIAGGTV
ncbi:MAG: ArsR/SmtB family transcription factor [Thermodesulfobacteriota bacterium]